MKLSGVYKIVNNENAKIYIGSAINLKKRETQHFWELKNNRHCNSYLQKSFNKYGSSNFSFEVISHCPPEVCINKEQYFIDLYKNNGFGMYNICETAGSVLGRKHSDETKKKISIKNKLFKPTEEQKEHLRKINTGKKQSKETIQKSANSRTGLIMSESAKKKISEGNKGKPKSEAHKKSLSEGQKNSVLCGRKIAKYDKEGNLLCVYDKIIHAAKDVNSCYGNIFAHLKGKRPTVRGFIFKYIGNVG